MEVRKAGGQVKQGWMEYIPEESKLHLNAYI